MTPPRKDDEHLPASEHELEAMRARAAEDRDAAGGAAGAGRLVVDADQLVADARRREQAQQRRDDGGAAAWRWRCRYR